MMGLGIFADGWKTYVAGGLLIAWGVGGLLMGKHTQDQAMEYVGEGLAVIGIGHKLDKIRHAPSGIPNANGP
jgi:hypothetical protein